LLDASIKVAGHRSDPACGALPLRWTTRARSAADHTPLRRPQRKSGPCGVASPNCC